MALLRRPSGRLGCPWGFRLKGFGSVKDKLWAVLRALVSRGLDFQDKFSMSVGLQAAAAWNFGTDLGF